MASRVANAPSHKGLSLLCLSHENLVHLNSFISNLRLFDRAWSIRVGSPIEVIILDSSARSFSFDYELGTHTKVRLSTTPGLDMVEKIRRGVEAAFHDVIMLWTVDDIFFADVVIDCYLDIIERGYACSGGARAQSGQSFVKRTKEALHLLEGLVKLEHVFAPYDAYIYFLSKKALIQPVITTLSAWTKGYNVYQYANLFEVSFAALMTCREISIYRSNQLMHISRYAATSLGSRAFNPVHLRSSSKCTVAFRELVTSYISFMLDEFSSARYHESIRQYPRCAVGLMMNAFVGSGVQSATISVELPLSERGLL